MEDLSSPIDWDLIRVNQATAWKPIPVIDRHLQRICLCVTAADLSITEGSLLPPVCEARVDGKHRAQCRTATALPQRTKQVKPLVYGSYPTPDVAYALRQQLVTREFADTSEVGTNTSIPLKSMIQNMHPKVERWALMLEGNLILPEPTVFNLAEISTERRLFQAENLNCGCVVEKDTRTGGVLPCLRMKVDGDEVQENIVLQARRSWIASWRVKWEGELQPEDCATHDCES